MIPSGMPTPAPTARPRLELGDGLDIGVAAVDMVDVEDVVGTEDVVDVVDMADAEIEGVEVALEVLEVVLEVAETELEVVAAAEDTPTIVTVVADARYSPSKSRS